MNNITREELVKTCKKEKDHKIRIRIVAVSMICMCNMLTRGF